ncbi:MAG: alginate export family protein [Holophagaceae bacterium]|nr:alginate export family protein [Holophagaceae bacterium]
MPRTTNHVILGLALTATASSLLAADESSPIKALASGKASLELRTRYEHVDDAAALKTADTLTNRLALAWRSGSWRGISAFAQFENISTLAEPRYFVPQTGYGRSVRAVVADPPLSQLNQFYVEWKGLRVGRQAINLDNQRFVGSVAWRQNDQTFTGATFTNKSWIPRTEFTIGHLTQVQNIFGQTKPITAALVNLHVAFVPQGHFRAFHYAFDEGDQSLRNLAGLVTKDTSFAHTGARLDGEAWNVLYDASFSTQKKYRDATDSGTLDAKYRFLGLGYRIAKEHTVMLVEERLDAAFKTPYATLHAWNGWADRFLATPAAGLVDRYGQYRGKAGAWSFEASHHAFSAEQGGAAYGRETDVLVGYKPKPWLTLLLKAADYRADAGTPTLGAANKNLKKLWFQTLLTF